MIKDLDFTGIDLIFVKAQLKLEELKAEFVVKPKPKVVHMPCGVCQDMAMARSQLMAGAQYSGAIGGGVLGGALGGAIGTFGSLLG